MNATFNEAINIRPIQPVRQYTMVVIGTRHAFPKAVWSLVAQQITSIIQAQPNIEIDQSVETHMSATRYRILFREDFIFTFEVLTTQSMWERQDMVTQLEMFAKLLEAKTFTIDSRNVDDK